MQLLRDNTVTVRKVNKALSLMLDGSIEKFCKIAFATDQIAFPCCLMVLPYTLNVNESSDRPIISSNSKLISLAVRLGKCFLDINKATARMSFWLRMGAKMKGQDSNAFKSQMQQVPCRLTLFALWSLTQLQKTSVGQSAKSLFFTKRT